MEIRTVDQDLSHRRALLHEGEVVSRLWLLDRQMRVGSATVRMAGIGGVRTEDEHRGKGYMRALMEDTLVYMREQGYDVSVLFGIPGFYDKFGYAACLLNSRIVVQTRDAESARAGSGSFAVRPIVETDMHAIIDLYNRNNALRTCSIVRASHQFTGFRRGTSWRVPAEALIVEDAARQAWGYAVLDRSDRSVTVIEVEGTDEQVFPALLYEFARKAVVRRCGEITLHLPPDHPFAEHAQGYGCECTILYPRNSYGMMRIINQETLFRKLSPELERRHAAGKPPHALDLTIVTDIGTTALRRSAGTLIIQSHRGTGAMVEMPQDKLIQLIAGFRRARDVLNDPRASATGSVVDVLDALFPKGQPYVWHTDSF